jgi:hypothetical protein
MIKSIRATIDLETVDGQRQTFTIITQKPCAMGDIPESLATTLRASLDKYAAEFTTAATADLKAEQSAHAETKKAHDKLVSVYGETLAKLADVEKKATDAVERAKQAKADVLAVKPAPIAAPIAVSDPQESTKRGHKHR